MDDFLENEVLLEDYNEDEYIPTREQWREEFFEYIDQYSDGNTKLDE